MSENSDANEVKSKPLNPEMEAVSLNRPTATRSTENLSIPKKIGKEKVEKSKRGFILGCFGGMFFLFVLFILLMVLMISRSGTSNPVMQAFGLDPSGVRNFLQGVVGFTLGFLAILFLVLLVIGLFRFLGAQKSDKEKRGSGLRILLINSFLLVFTVFVWVLLANFISQIEISAERIVAEIVVVDPNDISNLTAPVEVRFSALNVAKALEMGGVQIEAMNWDLDGDGTFETPVASPEVTHLYSKKGTYTVGLQVSVKGEGQNRDYNQVINIPDAAFAVEPQNGTAPLAVNFDASEIVDKSAVASLDWDFDNDGRYELEGSDQRPSYTFEQIGTYKVHLRAIDKNNNVENYYRDVDVVATDQPIISVLFDATPALKGVIPFQVRFDASRSKATKGNLIKYQWDFGDGSELQLGKGVSHVYEKPGKYQVTLFVEDDRENKAENTLQVEALNIASRPEAIITTTPAVSGDVLTGILPFKVRFDASKSNDPDNDIVQYSWDFDGDEVVDKEGKKVDNVYDQAGAYNAILTVQDSKGNSNVVSIKIEIQKPGVLASVTATPEEGTVPLLVQLDGSSSSAYEGRIVSYEWDFGDGSPKTITGATVTHKYSAVGAYTVKLTVLTNQNEFASGSKQIYVREIPLKACFSPSRTTGLTPLTVTFDSKCSTGAISSYRWTFGDSSESKLSSPTHTFDLPGTYTVLLEVSDSKNNVSTYQDVIVVQGELK